MKKDTIYIDIEDDITSIIEKVKASGSKIVALVPPKRSTALNSAVNMKLLMRAAEDSQKKLVLVTSEASLLSLAGGVGLHVTNNLHSKPYLPKPAESPLSDEAVIDGSEIDPTAPIGELADVQAATAAAPPGKKPPKSKSGDNKKTNKFSIPSFERFRGRLFLIGAAVILLLVAWWWAFWIAPKATIAIQAQTSRVATDFEFTADPEAESDDFERNIFRTEIIEVSRTVTEDFTPSGTKNIGDKASGTITIRNCDYGDGFTVQAGTTFEASGLSFESLEDIVVQPFSGPASNCDLDDSSEAGEGSGTVRALKPGDQYNLAPTTYAITGDSIGGKVDAVGSQMSGGTTKEAKVVAKKDVDEAREKLESQDRSDVLNELKNQVAEDYIAIDETFKVDIRNVKSQPEVGQEANSGSLNATVKFTLAAVPRETLVKAVEDFQQSRIEDGNQRIYENGTDTLSFSLLEQEGSQYQLRLRTDGYIGPELDADQLANDVAGKRYSEVVNIVRSRPGVIDVSVDFSPFWVASAPKADKITINFEIQSSTDTDNSAETPADE